MGFNSVKNYLCSIIVLRDFSFWRMFVIYTTFFLYLFHSLLYSCSFYFIYIYFFRFPFLCFFHSLSIYWKHSYWSTTTSARQKKFIEAPDFVKPINWMSALFALPSQSGTPGGLDWSASKCFFCSLRYKVTDRRLSGHQICYRCGKKKWTYAQIQTLLPSHFTSWTN